LLLVVVVVQEVAAAQEDIKRVHFLFLHLLHIPLLLVVEVLLVILKMDLVIRAVIQYLLQLLQLAAGVVAGGEPLQIHLKMAVVVAVVAQMISKLLLEEPGFRGREITGGQPLF
jgi:hypothetical protein